MKAKLNGKNNPVALIEFNEVNIILLKKYLADKNFVGRWSSLRRLVALPSVATKSENSYELLEPWVQWASVHNGLTAAQHKIFRLGDINSSNHPQLFEVIESKGYSVGSISAMNASNKLKSPAYFIPDPWTITKTDNSFISKSVYLALYQAVNDNASGKITKITLLRLIIGMLTNSKLKNFPTYINLFIKVLKKRNWNKALFLDLFISDLHLSYYSKSKPSFTTVFLNGFAHLQHHYLFSSKFYDGNQQNPTWYIDNNIDPFPEALDIYDRIIEQHFKTFSNHEIVVATGLQQVPYIKTKFYYRLKNHKEFISLIDEKVNIYPRMTRDFLIECENIKHAKNIEKKLNNIKINNKKFFEEIDNRGNSLFVTLTYPYEITAKDTLIIPEYKNVKALDYVVFVAIKNGMHDSLGHVFSSKPSENFKKLNNCHVCNLNNYILSKY